MNLLRVDTHAASRRTLATASRTRRLTAAFRVAVFTLIAVCVLAPRADAAPNVPTVYSFLAAPDGNNPYGSLVQDSNGNFWGTTGNGGAAGYGDVYEVMKGTNATVAVHSFTGQTAGDGSNPMAGLTLGRDGNLYGNTFNGGSNNKGCFFEIVPNATGPGGTYALLYSFGASAMDGQNPSGTAVQGPTGDDSFFVPCYNGGIYSKGVIVKISSAGVEDATDPYYEIGTYQTGALQDGSNPDGPLTLGTDGYIYGTCANGGYNALGRYTVLGVVFAVNDTFTQGQATCSAMNIQNGTTSYTGGLYPVGGVIQGTGTNSGKFYGVARQGGDADEGEVFSVTAKVLNTQSTLTDHLYDFHQYTTADGMYPSGNLVLASGGTQLVGTTQMGGAHGYGTIFEIPIGGTGGTASTPLYSFTDSGSDGDLPYAGLFSGTDGYFWGTTEDGGTAGDGVVYRFGPPSTYNYAFFDVSPPSAISIALGYGDIFSTDTAYAITTPTQGGTVKTGTSGTPTNPLNRTYTPKNTFTNGTDTFKYTVMNALGTSTSTYGNVSVFVGAPSASYTPNPVTGTTAALTVAGANWVASDATLLYTWTTTTVPTGGAATYGAANGTNAAKTSLPVTFTKMGTYTLTCSITSPDVNPVANMTGSNTYTTLTLTVTVAQTPTPSSFAISPANATVPAGSAATTYVTVPTPITDQFGTPIPPVWSISTTGGTGSTINSSSGLLTAGATQGTETVTAKVGTGAQQASASTTVTISAPALTLANPAKANGSASPPTVTVTGKTAALTVLATYPGEASNIQYTWASSPSAGVTFSDNADNTAQNCTATFPSVGTYTLTATIQYSASTITSSVTVNVVSTGTTIAMTPYSATAPGPGLEYGTSQAFSATVKDQFGNVLATQPAITWTANDTYTPSTGPSTTVTYSSGTAGLYSVTATDAADGISKTSDYTDYRDKPLITSATGAPSPVAPTANLTLTAIADWQFGTTGLYSTGTNALTFAWTQTGGPTTLTIPSGTTTYGSASPYAATNTVVVPLPSNAAMGTYTFQVTVTPPAGAAYSVMATVTVTVAYTQVATSVSIVPASETVEPGTTTTLTATVYDQYGQALSPQPTISWAITDTGGAASTLGSATGASTTLISGASNGTATVKATGGGVSATSVYTIQPTPPTVVNAAAANGVTGTYTDNNADTAVTLTALGSYGGSASNLTYTWAETSGPSGATFAPNGTNAAQTSTATMTQAGTYVFQVTIKTPDGLTVTSSVTVILKAVVSRLTVTPSGNPLYIGYKSKVQFTATEADQFGNTTATPTIAWITNIEPITANGLLTASSIGTDSVGAFDSTNNLTTFVNIDVVNVAPSVATAAAATPNPVTGKTTNLSVLGQWLSGTNDLGESNLTYTWHPSGTQPGTVTFSANGTNASKNTVATFSAAGTYVLFVTITAPNNKMVNSPAGSPYLVITVMQTVTTIAVTPASASPALGGTLTFTAAANDQFGAAFSSPPTFTWSTSLGSIGSSSGTYTATASGSGTVTASVGSVTGTATVTVADSAPTFLTGITLNPSPIIGASGLFKVTGNYNGTGPLTYAYTITSAPAGAPTVTFAGGTSGNPGVQVATTGTFGEAGPYTLKATVTSPSGLSASTTLSFTVNATYSSVTVSPNPISVPVGGMQTFTAVAYDQFHMALTPQPSFTWSVSNTNGAASTINSGTGVLTAGGAPGNATVTGASGAFSDTSAVTITDVAPTVGTVTVAPSPVTGTAATFTVTGSYAGNGPLAYAWTVTGPQTVNVTGGASGAPGSPVAATGTFAQAGSYTVYVTVTTPQGQTVNSATVPFTVAQTATGIQINPDPSSVAITGTETLNASEFDQFGTAMASQPTFAWSIVSGGGSIGASGASTTFTGGAAVGTTTIKVAAGAVSQTGTVHVLNQPPTVATSAEANGVAVQYTTTAASVNLTVLGAYAGGESNLTYTWSLTSSPATVTYSANGSNAAKNTTATFTKSGTYDFHVQITDTAGGVTGSDVEVVVQQVLTTISVTPGPTDTEYINTGTQTYTATGYGQFGFPMATQPTFTWSTTGLPGSSINSSTGVFTVGPNPGTATVTATSGSVSGSTVVTVDDVAPTVQTAASANPSPVTGTSTVLSVLGQYPSGESRLHYTWVATTIPSGAPAVVFSGATNGTNASKTITATFGQAGSYSFTVTISDGVGGSTTSSVTVSVVQTRTTVTVTPSPATVAINGTVSFMATASDQFGALLSGQTFAWSVHGGVGTITTPGGVYSAGGTPGTATVEASDGGPVADVPVTVTDLPLTVGAITVNPDPVTGTTATFTATGTYAGSGALTYTWDTVGTPPAPLIFSGGTSGTSGSAVTATGTFSKAGVYTARVTVTDAFGTTATQTVTFTVSQTPTALGVSPTPVSVPIGGTQQFTGAVTDQFGDALSTQPAFTWSATNGSITTGGLYTAPTALGSATVTATADSLTAMASVADVDAPPTVATAASANPNPVTTGTTTSLSVLGAYIGGESGLTYTWSVSSPDPVTFSANGTNAAKNTTATFTGAGTYVLSVTIADANGESGSSTVTVVVDQANGPITIAPGTATLPIGGTQSFTATQTDQFGDPLPSQPTFTWSVASGIGAVDSIGDYTAPLTPGTATVKAASASGSATVAITVADVAPTVATAASASPNTVTGTTAALSVLGAYAGGEGNLTYTWSETSGPTGATFSVNGTNAAKATTATFTKAGAYVFKATIADAYGEAVTSFVTVTVNQTLTAITVSPKSAATTINGTQQFTVATTDQFGNPIAVPITWAVTAGGGTVSSTGLFTGSSAPGDSTVTASSEGLSDVGQVMVNDTPVTVATAASASPSPVTGTMTSLSVLGAYGGGEGDLTYAWSETSGPTGVTYSANGTNAAKSTTATFTQAGTYTFLATIADANGESVTSSVTVTVNETLTTIAISPTSTVVTVGGTQQFTASATDQFGNALVPQPSFTYSLASGPGSVSTVGLYTANATAGTATVKVTAGSQSATATATVMDAAPTVATAASATPSPVTAKTTALSVLGAYAAGESNLTYTWSMTSGPAAVTYSANGTNGAKATTVTFTHAGSYTFLVTIATPSGLTAISSVTVPVNQTPAAYSVSPATANVNVFGTLQLTALETDQFGNPMDPQPTTTWTIVSGAGMVSATGGFTALGSAGTTVVRGTAGSFSATLTLTIIDQPPTFMTAPTATPSPVMGKTTALSALGSYVGGESTLTYTWAVVSGPASVAFSANGTNAAKNCTATFTQAGSYNLSVTMKTQSGLTTTGNVTVVVNQTPTSVAVTPNPGTVGAGLTLQMTATSKDQFGNALSPPPSFAWTVASGGGTISASGLYTAPAATGTATVKATAGSASGTATINVINAGTLMGSVSTSSAAVNLTTQGTLDWEHWGRGAPGLDRKASGSLLTPYTLIGGGSASSYRTDPRLLSWTDGTPTATSTNNATGVDLGGIGSGYQLMAPASTTMRTAVIYVGGINAGGTLTASLSDGSSGMYVNTQPTTSGVWDAEYTITYAAGSANANLVVTWVQASGSTGAVTLSAMTLH